MTKFRYKVGEKLKYQGRVATITDSWWDGNENRYEVLMGRNFWTVLENTLRIENDNKKIRQKTLCKV